MHVELMQEGIDILREMEEDPTTYWIYELINVFDQVLSEGGASGNLKKDDPIAYNQELMNYFDGETGRLFALKQDDYNELQGALYEAQNAHRALRELINKIKEKRCALV